MSQPAGDPLVGDARATALPSSTRDGKTGDRKPDFDRLYTAALQKFLSYSVIAVATFFGSLQLAYVAHTSSEHGLVEAILVLLVLALWAWFVAFAWMVLRQYSIISVLEDDEHLGVRTLENELVRNAPPLVYNATAYAHYVAEHSATKKAWNVMTAVLLLLIALGFLVMIYAVTS